jgi:hypothetical protein
MVVADFPRGAKLAFARSFTRRTERSSRLPRRVRAMVNLNLLEREKVRLTFATSTGVRLRLRRAPLRT